MLLYAPPDHSKGVGQLFLRGLLLQGGYRLLDLFVAVQALVSGLIH